MRTVDKGVSIKALLEAIGNDPQPLWSMSRDNASAPVLQLHALWRDEWTSRISPYVEETKGGRDDTPGVDFGDLAIGRYNYEAYPQDLLRKMRRLFSRFRLEAFVEARTFADYRVRLQEEWQGLLEEVKQTRNATEAARDFVRRLRDDLKAQFLATSSDQNNKLLSTAQQQLEAIGIALETASSQTDAVGSVFRDRRFEAHVLELLRNDHNFVQTSWGTWPRRLKRPAALGLVGLVVALALQGLTGFTTGSQLILTASLLLPISVFAWGYYRGRERAIQRLQKTVSRLCVFDPEPDQRGLSLDEKAPERAAVDDNAQPGFLDRLFKRRVPTSPAPLPPSPTVLLSLRENTIWRRGESKLTLDELATRTYLSVVQKGDPPPGQDTYRTSDVRVSSGVWATAIVFVFGGLVAVPVVRLLSDGANVFTVEAGSAGDACVLAKGHVLWPGPIEVIVKETNGVVVIPRDRISRVSEGDGGLRRCGSTVPTLVPREASAPLVIMSKTQARDRGVLVVPFTTSQSISCGFRAEEVTVGKADTLVLRRIGKALQRCGETTGVPPVIDVRGFASAVPFAGCEADKTNLELAHTRRANVLSAMFDQPIRSRTDARRWALDHVVISPDRPDRWRDVEHMREFSSIDDTPGSLQSVVAADVAQRAEVWFHDLGGCLRQEIVVIGS